MSFEDLPIITIDTDVSKIPFHVLTSYLANEMDEGTEYTPEPLMELIATYWDLVFEQNVTFTKAVLMDGPEGWIRANN